jgi:hypothetical protein
MTKNPIIIIIIIIVASWVGYSTTTKHPQLFLFCLLAWWALSIKIPLYLCMWHTTLPTPSQQIYGTQLFYYPNQVVASLIFEIFLMKRGNFKFNFSASFLITFSNVNNINIIYFSSDSKHSRHAEKLTLLTIFLKVLKKFNNKL